MQALESHYAGYVQLSAIKTLFLDISINWEIRTKTIIAAAP